MNTNDNASFLFGCTNCRRRQSQSLIEQYGQVAPYYISFQTYRTNEVKNRRKFKLFRSNRLQNNARDILLCIECANHLINEDDSKIHKNPPVPARCFDTIFHSCFPNLLKSFVPLRNNNKNPKKQM